MMMMPQVSQEEMRLVKYVKCTACTQFALGAGSQIIAALLMMAALSQVPTSYHEFVEDCYGSGEIPQQFQQICNSWSDHCQQKGYSISQCNNDGEFTNLLGTFKAAALGIAFVTIALGCCCAACVPACGFFGARDRNSCQLCTYMVFNIISLAFGAYSVLVALNFVAVIGMIMPFVSTYFACKLHSMITNPVQQMPLMNAGQFVQPVSVQPIVAQPVQVQPVAPMGQQPQQALYNAQ